MRPIRTHLRRIAGVTLLAFAGMTAGLPAAQAGLIGTEQAVAGAAAAEARASLSATLARAEVADRLAALGVERAALEARIAALSDAEVQHLAAQIDSAPAGGDIVGAAVFVFLVLLITDIAGLTDIFPFVKK